MLQGVYIAYRRDKTPYYRASIHHKNKHVTLGSYDTETEAHEAYIEAQKLYSDKSITIDNYHNSYRILDHDRVITILNHRDNAIYIKTPIYLRKGFFSYYLSKDIELKFDNDDLFYYSSHRILTRKGHLYVNDYGMQYNILSRFGIKNYAVKGSDYTFANSDEHDYRYSNIIVINKYHGVHKITKDGIDYYEVKIHFNGDYIIGRFSNEEKAAIAYNKAVDYARDNGIEKNYTENYLEDISPKDYAHIYSQIKLPKKYTEYIDTLKD